MEHKLISASILSANFAKLGEEAQAVLSAGCDLIHFDVMDNHYVPNLTFGPMICKSLRDYGIKAPIDVHLMTNPVDSLIIDFAKAGATWISFHPEASKHIDRSLQLIIDNGCKAGLALNPATPISCLEHVLDKISFVVVMSVNPGFGGQKFIPNSLEKIKKLRSMIGDNIIIEVDGGIKINNIQEIADAGADSFVMGSAIFNAEKDYTTIISEIRKKI